MNKYCTYYDRSSKTPVRDRIYHYYSFIADKFEDITISAKYVKCPECGRKVRQRISFCHYMCCIVYLMPQHKIKGWYKEKGKVKRKNSRDKVGQIRNR